MTSRTRTRANAPARRKPPKRPGLGPRGWLTVVGVVVGVGVLLFAAFGLDADADRPSAAEFAGAPTVEGTALPTLQDPVRDPAVGQPVPVARGTDLTGGASIVGEPGTPQVLLFLASWCPSCQQELPEVVTWLEAGGLPDEVQLTAVLTGLDDNRPNWPPDRWLERENYTGRVLIDDTDGTVGSAYGLSGTPFWVFVAADGTVAGRAAGLLPIDAVDATVRQLAANAG